RIDRQRQPESHDRLFVFDDGRRSSCPEETQNSLNLWLFFEFVEQLLSLHYKRLDDILTGDFAHRHAVFEDHSHAAPERNAELRIVRFAWTIHRTTHNRKMQRLFDVRQTPFDLRHDLDKVIDVEPAASRTSNHCHASRSQPERFHDLPRDAHFFL